MRPLFRSFTASIRLHICDDHSPRFEECRTSVISSACDVWRSSVRVFSQILSHSSLADHTIGAFNDSLLHTANLDAIFAKCALRMDLICAISMIFMDYIAEVLMNELSHFSDLLILAFNPDDNDGDSLDDNINHNINGVNKSINNHNNNNNSHQQVPI